MARVKISEWKAKQILLGEGYNGVQIRLGKKQALSASKKWVVKVDQGIKKRFKQGLVKVGVSAGEAVTATKEWEKKGFTQFIAEPVFQHENNEEQYLSLERVRDGVRLLYTKDGGVNIEEHPDKVQMLVLSTPESILSAETQTGLPHGFLVSLVEKFEKSFMTFLEINPLVVRENGVALLDAACLVDSAGAYFTREWSEDDVVKSKAKHDVEKHVEDLAATTPASLKLSVLNPDGALFLLLSGGGGSIVIADEAQALGAGKLLGNYGEYSGGPTREETYLYTKEVLALMLDSKAKKKALVIAGGVANFTDIKSTFAGVIDALSESAEKLRKQGIKVFVRRGGPNEAAGLAHMRTFLEKENLLGSIYSSVDPITAAMRDAIHFIK
ncbi:hypothetical protein EBR66_02240 [bacterium]|nr:hypothetical protein [bacterium]